MNIRQSFFIFPLLLLGTLLLLASGCKKDDEDKDDIEPITGTYQDLRDGNVYKTVVIGEQVWMAENLRFLPEVVGPGTGSKTARHYYVYGYNGTDVTEAKATANYLTYGVLYNWHAAMAGFDSSMDGVQGICPAGWHLPGDLEWNELSEYLGGKSLAGGKLKETGTSHWKTPNEGATNKSGFTALPGGGRSSNGAFGLNGSNGYWWSSFGSEYAWQWSLSYNVKTLVSHGEFKETGLSVRCVKD
jgi:uncharacterized protein (TIGR02145 family)